MSPKSGAPWDYYIARQRIQHSTIRVTAHHLGGGGPHSLVAFSDACLETAQKVIDFKIHGKPVRRKPDYWRMHIASRQSFCDCQLNLGIDWEFVGSRKGLCFLHLHRAYIHEPSAYFVLFCALNQGLASTTKSPYWLNQCIERIKLPKTERIYLIERIKLIMFSVNYLIEQIMVSSPMQKWIKEIHSQFFIQKKL
jgi:hypothetical protein